MSNDQKIKNAWDIGEVLLVWCIVLAILHLKFVKMRQMSQAAEQLDNFCSPQLCQQIKKHGLMCDARTWIFLVVNITIISKIFPMETILTILCPTLAAIVVLGIMLEIHLIALKVELVFKRMNASIQVQFNTLKPEKIFLIIY